MVCIDLSFAYLLCVGEQVTHPLWVLVFPSMKWEQGFSLKGLLQQLMYKFLVTSEVSSTRQMPGLPVRTLSEGRNRSPACSKDRGKGSGLRPKMRGHGVNEWEEEERRGQRGERAVLSKAISTLSPFVYVPISPLGGCGLG